MYGLEEVGDLGVRVQGVRGFLGDLGGVGVNGFVVFSGISGLWVEGPRQVRALGGGADIEPEALHRAGLRFDELSAEECCWRVMRRSNYLQQ